MKVLGKGTWETAYRTTGRRVRGEQERIKKKKKKKKRDKKKIVNDQKKIWEKGEGRMR